jgi:hypothetical protein
MSAFDYFAMAFFAAAILFLNYQDRRHSERLEAIENHLHEKFGERP